MPTVNAGMVKSFYDTVGQKRSIADLILMLSPDDVPLLQWMPGTQVPVIGTKHEWLEDELVPVASTIAEALDTSETGIDVATGTGKFFLPDDLVKVGNEVMLVTAVTGDTLTVAARGYGSTDAANHDSGKAITRIGVAKKEGADAGEPRYTNKTAGYNYTQIFDEIVKVSGTAEAIAEYGIDSRYAREMMKVLKQKAILMEQAVMHGVRHEDVTNERRTMGGLLEFLQTNRVNANGLALTRPVLNDLTHEAWRNGGTPRTLIMNIDQKQRLYDMYEGRIRTSQSETNLGGRITSFENDLGVFDIILDRWVPRDTILLLDRELVGLGPLQGREWSHELMGKRGDFVHGQIVGEYTMEVRGEYAHGLITGLAY